MALTEEMKFKIQESAHSSSSKNKKRFYLTSKNSPLEGKTETPFIRRYLSVHPDTVICSR